MTKWWRSWKVRNISSINHRKLSTPNASRWKRGQGRYPTNSGRRRSSEAFVISELHLCWTFRLTIIILTGNQLRQDLRRWLSPPDPSKNHNIACNAHHKGTATWFFEGRTYQEWKSTGSESLLWIHGKRVPVPFCHLTPPNNDPYL